MSNKLCWLIRKLIKLFWDYRKVDYDFSRRATHKVKFVKILSLSNINILILILILLSKIKNNIIIVIVIIIIYFYLICNLKPVVGMSNKVCIGKLIDFFRGLQTSRFCLGRRVFP